MGIELKPTNIRLDFSTFCQLKCPSCPTGTGYIKKYATPSHLKPEDFERFLAANTNIKKIEASNFGEVFLNPALSELLRIALDKEVKITISNGANFVTCTDEALESCVKYKVEHITCSIDGATQESYEKYRIGGKFESAITNIKKLNEFKKKYNSEFPRLTWQFIIFGHNENEVEKAKKLAKELNMEFVPKLSWDEEFSPIVNAEKVKKASGLSSVSRSEHQSSNQKSYLNTICHQMWTSPQINSDGKLFGCCINYMSDFGNVFEKDFFAGPQLRKNEYGEIHAQR